MKVIGCGAGTDGGGGGERLSSSLRANVMETSPPSSSAYRGDSACSRSSLSEVKTRSEEASL